MGTSQLPDRVACYRHVDHLTRVRCSRCGQPICPECVIVAQVGHHCPACAAEDAAGSEANRSPWWSLSRPRAPSASGAPGTEGSRRPSGSAGACTASGVDGARPLATGDGRDRRLARSPGARTGRFTPVVAVLILVNVVAYALTSSHGTWLLDYAQVPPLVAHGQVYRMLTSTFVHEDFTHLLFNMVALFLMGPPVEVALGRKRFLALYLLAALGGSVCYFVFGPVAVAAVGASGAIFGVVGAWFALARAQRSDTAAIVLLIAFLLAYSFYDTAIDWGAHVGGLVTGVAVATVFAWAARRPARSRLAYEAVAVAGLLGLFAASVVVRSAQI